MKKRIGILAAVVLVVLLAAYLGVSYVVYDKLSRVGLLLLDVGLAVANRETRPK